jgi:Ni/Co efflux regulator RcnB
MKRLITSALALTLLMGGAAMAQDRDKHGGGKHEHRGQPQAHQGGGKHDNARANPAVRHDNRAPNWDRNRNDNRGHDRDRRDNRHDNRSANWDNRHNDNRGPNRDRRNDYRNPGVHRGAHQRPRTFNRRAYQRNVWARRKFRHGVYHRPHGWYYRRWTYGQILPFAFFARDYWLNDWWIYDLPAPPYGYEWVRYGDDAILVDIRTGTILQVIYGVFY